MLPPLHLARAGIPVEGRLTGSFMTRDVDTLTYRFPKGNIMTILRWIAACGVAVAAFMLPLLAYS